MSGAGDGSIYALPVDQGHLGQEVEGALHLVADLVYPLKLSAHDDMLRRVLEVANYAAVQLDFLTERKEEVGRLCAAVERELMRAEFILRLLKQLAIGWTHGDVRHPRPDPDEGWETILPRSEYIQSMIGLADLIRQRFPGDTAERWRLMAQLATGEEPPPEHMEL